VSIFAFDSRSSRTEIECLLRLLFDLLDVVQTLKNDFRVSTAVSRQGYRYQFVVLFARFDLELGAVFSIELTLRPPAQKMRDRAARSHLTITGMRDAFGVANVL